MFHKQTVSLLPQATGYVIPYTVEMQGKQNTAALVVLGMHSYMSPCKVDLLLGPDQSSQFFCLYFILKLFTHP